MALYSHFHVLIIDARSGYSGASNSVNKDDGIDHEAHEEKHHLDVSRFSEF